ncbi:MAG: YceH family protein [Phycisphaerae bacterium]
MPLTLSALQHRTLAVFMEKAFTTPEQYPLTINALVAGCNQKSNRDPVTSHTESDVVNALQELMHMQLVKSTPSQPGARANRYEHCVTAKFPWAPHEQAMLCELLLRGPQTVGELRTRASRMVHIGDLQTVQNTLDALGANDPPEVLVMPRSAGKSVVRYRHNFYLEDEVPQDGVPVRTSTGATTSASHPAPDPDLLARLNDLETRVAALEDRIHSPTDT